MIPIPTPRCDDCTVVGGDLVVGGALVAERWTGTIVIGPGPSPGRNVGGDLTIE